MIFKQGRRLSSAHVISLLSLFVAMSGWAYAASVEKNSVTSGSVRNDSLKGKDVKDESLTSADVDESTLDGIQGPAGPPGQQGPPGPATGPAGGALTGTYPDPGLALGVVGSANLSANLADVLDANDIASQGVDDAELSDDLANTVDANDIAPQGVDESELSDDLGDTIDENDIAPGAIEKTELGTITLNSATTIVSGGGTAQNGNMDTRSAIARCDPWEIMIGGGAHWSPAAADNEELYLVESSPQPPIDWFARGGNDSGTDRTLVVEALCLGSQ